MMADLSLSDLDPGTPIASVVAGAKSRRISILPIAHADLSSPTTARQQLQVLELENMGLMEELTHSEREKKALEAQVEVLRLQVSSSSLPPRLLPLLPRLLRLLQRCSGREARYETKCR